MRLLVVVLSSFAASSSLFASPPSADIKVRGNERTRTSYLTRMTEVCLAHQTEDRPAGPWSAEELKQCLLNSRLFSHVDATIQRHTVHVTVEEKWTLIPIPMVTAGSGKNKRAGVFLLESNFLGLGMSLAAGGTVSNNGTSYFGALSDPSLFFTHWHYTLIMSRQNEDILQITGDAVTDGFRESASNYSGTLGYRMRHWSLNWSLARNERTFKHYESFTAPAPTSANRAGLSLSYDRRDYKLYFSEGLAFRAGAQIQMNQRGDEQAPHSTIDGQVSWQQLAYADHAIQLLFASGGVRGGSKTDTFRLGGGRGFRGIEPRSAWAEHYIAGAADYQVPVRSFDSGTWTIAPFLDAGRIKQRSGVTSEILYYALGGGTYFFLKHIALPGLGFEFGYNNEYMGEFFTLSVGLSL